VPHILRLRAPLAVLALVLPVLAVAPPGAARADAPETVVGELVQAWPEFAEAHEAAHRSEEGPLSWVETPDGDSVRVPTDDLPRAAGLAAGAVVEVTLGAEVTDEAAQEGLEPARAVVDVEVLEAAPAPALAASSTNQVTVVMVQPGGVPADGRRLADVVAAVDGPVRAFWAEETGGRVQLQVTGQHDWMSTTATCASPSALWSEVAAAVGWTSGPGKHLLLYVSRTAPSCGAGLAQVGSGIAAGGRLWVTDVMTSLIAHEFGHNFSLGHASARQCHASVDAGSCRVVAYDDGYDVMGYSWGEVGSLGAPHAHRLDVLAPGRVVTVAAGSPVTTVSLSPVSSTSGVRALRLVDGSGAQYWLELRTATGRDDWLGTGRDVFGLGAGVLVRQAATGADTSLLLDASPSPSSGWDQDRQVSLRTAGQQVVLAGGRFRVELRSVSAGAAEIRVSGPAPAPAPAPAPPHPVDALHQATGGDAGRLGPAAGALSCGLPAGGCARAFTHAVIIWSPATGAHVVLGSIGQRYAQYGREAGSLGYPVSGEVCGLRGGGCFQPFQGGAVYWSPPTGAHVVLGAIGHRWAQQGWETGSLGYPVGGEVCRLRDGGCFQPFQGGAIYWSPRSGAHPVGGFAWPLSNAWGAQGWERGRLGYPVEAPRSAPRRGVVMEQRFQGGLLVLDARGRVSRR
jgi:hypothetical protein